MIEEVIAVIALVTWACVAMLTAAARDYEVRDQEAAAVAAGVLWPIYLPYRLALIVWSKQP